MDDITIWIVLAVVFAVCFTGSLLFTLFRIKKNKQVSPKNKKDKKQD